MNPLSQFTDKENIKMLWDVLLDELHLTHSNKNIVNNVRIIFDSNIQPFVTKANPKMNMLNLNKHFLSQVLLAVNRLMPNLQDPPMKKITIYPEEENTEPYKIEDLQASRQQEFEKAFELKRMEMENYMTPQKPKQVDFSDKMVDEKIKSMDYLVSEKMAQRNLELETLQNSQYNMQNSQYNMETNNWFLEQEKEKKQEKEKEKEKEQETNNQTNNRLKYLSFDSNNNVQLSIHEKPKKVSWNDQPSTVSIFDKLKKNVYPEQKSVPLPELKQEEMNRNKHTQLTNNNEPLLPKVEIVRQLNEMNNKIDNLYEMLFKLTKRMEKEEELREEII
jgi:DNA-nicking Smr family endonuclease